MNWRKETGADSIIEKYQEPEVMAKYYAGGLYGQDREGRPIWINPLGNLDIKGLKHCNCISDDGTQDA